MWFTLKDFVRESNRIEGILREPTTEEINAHGRLLVLPHIAVADLCQFVGHVQPDADLRMQPGMNVYVGDHMPPPGGPSIGTRLENLLAFCERHGPYKTHIAYEMLHPFTDGNGRSGRALWLWQMGGIDKAPLGFLHHFYYQTLAAAG